jgi:hypothetical protein
MGTTQATLEYQVFELPLFQYQQQGALLFNFHLPPTGYFIHGAIATQTKLRSFVHLADIDTRRCDGSHAFLG